MELAARTTFLRGVVPPVGFQVRRLAGSFGSFCQGQTLKLHVFHQEALVFSLFCC